MPVDSKILKSKYYSHTDEDEYVRTLLPKLDHVRELARLNVIDFKEKYKKAYDKKYKVKPTKLRVGTYVYIEQKRMKIGDISHLTTYFIGQFVISEKLGQASFNVKHCDTMIKLPSPVHAERMKLAQFDSLERFRTEGPFFGKEALDATRAQAESLKVTEDQPTDMTDDTVTKTTDSEQTSDKEDVETIQL